MILLLFGPPGCGKGTQAALAAQRFHIANISTGEMFRAECKAGTELGKAAREIMSKGGLVGDDLVNGIVANRIAREDCAGGFLLDGYPRTVEQAKAFAALLRERGLPQPMVIHLSAPDEPLVARLTARRQCPQCKKIYNMQSQPPRVEGVCDDDGARLDTRGDDREAVIRDRLRAYRELTGPVLAWFGASGVHTVDGTTTPAEVWREIERVVLAAQQPLAMA